MSRGKAAPKRVTMPDPVYGNELVGRFINFLMERGKKSVAQAIVYDALTLVKAKKNEDPVKIFEQVINTAKPQVEVRSRRVGGANYQVPMPVVGNRQDALAFRWIIAAARTRKGNMAEKLSAEFLDILEGTGGTMKKRDDVHRMAEANKAFAHFARRG
ncbi:MAG: 30S ribosomal protein S7 [Candidatus Magasanikbacteria bacterium GW2011_GWD2_43_18]|uniref:Small ribosomal subunit protein uS7 n=1 Tax=Candidatus Magasanikbacteria bacterium GW2011_GWE2_42_7 TaxID=1619052 RepID=A0A0G1BGW1_9BACT|nr:MAG: 30S ribosomal protein S7 [Candidatus Magasanikbacteria bacterium GW2011_GWC2_42_27]KKS72620.1 MAG: 30S ribosomal protein S7 [Candidatus Magasanikbacteria bacterium GW2011_GWE2_42_7]KKT05108.1 MAG: 30S ribosomal protein S7 [Candidatus Magasanikbacteria bacterium GW2011_GWD2_43_18]KKT24599.1 MAG: 30S ribosomal protein S7 [Candidatus Magasanikbacteria bacterium GW2011_GWA2_43_9]HBB38086.1 30S ribosomal protein S7 [Candidatus Magasanikbacteria bacterium]